MLRRTSHTRSIGRKDEAPESLDGQLPLNAELFLKDVWTQYTTTGSIDYIDPAIMILQKAIRLGQDTSDTHFRLGQFLFAKGNHGESCQHFEISLERDARNSRATTMEEYCQTGHYCTNCATGISRPVTMTRAISDYCRSCYTDKAVHTHLL